jgi:hypothetical protein
VLAQEVLDAEQTAAFGQPLRRLMTNGAIGGEKLGCALAQFEVVLRLCAACEQQRPNAERHPETGP